MARKREANVNGLGANWYIDIGASQHFTNINDWCLDFLVNKTTSNSVIFGGGEEYKIAIKGNVKGKVKGCFSLMCSLFLIGK
jgi:hypothetical protein